MELKELNNDDPITFYINGYEVVISLFGVIELAEKTSVIYADTNKISFRIDLNQSAFVVTWGKYCNQKYPIVDLVKLIQKRDTAKKDERRKTLERNAKQRKYRKEHPLPKLPNTFHGLQD